MIQHPPHPPHPSQRPGRGRRDWNERPPQGRPPQDRLPQDWSSPYGRDRDYEPEPAQAPYFRDRVRDRGEQSGQAWQEEASRGDVPHNPEWHQDQQYGRPSYAPPQQNQDWQQSEGWQRGRGYRARDLDREQAHELDDYYAERYASTPPQQEQFAGRGRPRYGAQPSYRGGVPPQQRGMQYTPSSEQSGHPEADTYRPEQYSGVGSWNAGGNAPPRNHRQQARMPGEPQRAAPVNYRGRAPKGYVRADERIHEDICERLSEDPRVDASDISVSVRDGVVTLEGSVAERAQKHRSEDIADACGGVKDIRNQLTVSRRGNGNGRDTHREARTRT